ncbi:MAG: AI-2E family transporter [bacterium]
MESDRTLKISTKSVVYAVLVVALLASLYYIRELVFIFLTSVVVASFVESGVRKFKIHGIGRTFAVIFIYFLVLTICGVLMYLFVPIFLEQMSQFSGFFAKYLPDSTALIDQSQFSGMFANFQNIASSASGGVLQVAIAIFGGVFNFVILIVLSFYLSINERAIETFLRIASPEKNVEKVVGIWKRTQRKIGLWFQGQLLLGLLVGVLIYLGLLIFNIKYSFLLALVAAVLELIPFGIILAALPAIASGFSSHGSTGAFEVFGLYLIVHEFEINLISPLIVQKVVGISSLVVILSILIGLNLAGFWGIILAIPVSVFLMELFEEIKKQKGITDYE